MALTIAIGALKGGVGKSTLALNLAACLHGEGHRTVLVDCDPQASLRGWARVAAAGGHDGPPVVGIEGSTLRRDLDRVAEGFDVAVIDCPPRLGSELRAAMLAADLVVIPLTPGAPDLWAMQQTIAVLDEARGFRPELRAVAVLNRMTGNALARAFPRALAESGVELQAVTLGQRVAFARSWSKGQGVTDFEPRGAAAIEIRALAAALLAAVGGENGEARRAS